MSETLSQYREIWNRKSVLRLLYDDIFQRVADCVVNGPTLELGGGIGNLKEKIASLISSDIQFSPWLDLVADAQRLPFADNSLSNIVMVDVLHHIEFSSLLFREAARVLCPGGRLVLVEPGITFGSTLFFRIFHHEPVTMNVDPLAEGSPDQHRDPYDSNQAIPTLLATRYREQFHQKFPELCIRETKWFSFVAYPCSGGFKRWSLISERVARKLLWIEKKLEPRFGRILGFRLLLVIEKGLASEIRS
jgi:SAM-dependent methyltransferase